MFKYKINNEKYEAIKATLATSQTNASNQESQIKADGSTPEATV